MSSAADALLGGDREKGAALFARADSLRVRHWLNPAWSLEVKDGAHVREAKPQGDTARVPKEQHDKRNVPAAVRRAVLERDGFRSHF